MNVTILDDYFDTIRTLPCFPKLAGQAVTVWNDHVQDTERLIERLAATEALVLFRERTRIEAGLLDHLPKLKVISQRSGYPHIDLLACTRNGVMLCSNMHAGTPSYAAAELTFGLIIAAMRQIPQQMVNLRSGGWQMGIGHSLRGKILGIHSYGRIGEAVAGYGRAFGMEVQVFGGEASSARARVDGLRVVAKRDDFFASSDVISLHIRLNEATRGKVTAADLARMKPEALLVNTSRSGVIKDGALVDALQAGRPGMAAVDVFETEPVLNAAHPLLAMNNVICTPHIGYVTHEELDLQFSDIFDQIVAFEQGKPINVINTDILDHEVLEDDRS